MRRDRIGTGSSIVWDPVNQILLSTCTAADVNINLRSVRTGIPGWLHMPIYNPMRFVASKACLM